MVEMDNLAEKPIDKIRSEAGYICGKCKAFQRIYITTDSLKNAFGKLERFDAGHKDFYWHFGKVLKKAIWIQKEKPWHALA